VPRLLDLLARHGARATFLFSLGPDSTGKAVKRVFRRGFVKKVMSASPAASYGIRTMLYGTLLPAPDIGTRKEAVLRMREAAAAGHECGVHAWDHVDWHDRLPRMDRGEVFGTFGRAADRFVEVFGRAAEVAGAPGWTANGLSVEAYEARGIRVSSDTRGGPPFHPLRADGIPSSLVEVPSTLPTLDELLAFDEFRGESREGVIEHLRKAVRETEGTSVHSVHTEIEGGRAFAGLFARQLGAWASDGVAFVTLTDVAGSAGTLTARPLRFTAVRGRAVPVTTGEPAA
jgi:peptidoglycan/xylan/chitin deacetylase (PgdA/CDA1 family)